MNTTVRRIEQTLRGVQLTRAEADEIIALVNSRATLPDSEEAHS